MLTVENSLIERYSTVKSRIDIAAGTYHRKPDSVKLLAVSKTRPAPELVSLYRLGQRDFGESYIQEALTKQKQLAHFEIAWHFIGPIQSNKTKSIAHYFSWAHSVDRLKIAQRLNEQRPDFLPPLNICLQINISNESSKSGFALTDLPEVVERIKNLSNLRLRGVMSIPEPESHFEKKRLPYQTLIKYIKQHKLACYFDTYSFGMSSDLEAGIAEGATMVRIGTDIFGPRAKKQV